MPNVARLQLRKLNEREEAFLANFFDPSYEGDLVLAYIDAGYSDGPKANCNARAKLRELSDHVRIRAFDRMGTHVPWAISELVLLAKSTKNDLVKLKCLSEIFDRAGLNQPLVIDNRGEKEPSHLSTKELAQEVARLLDKAGKPSLKVVGGTDEE